MAIPYKLSALVVRVMEEAAISEEDLEGMVRRAALITHDRGNRRYKSWLFLIKDGEILDLQKLEMTDYSSGADSVIEECEDCWGDGCMHCGWIGQVRRLRI